MSGNFIHCAPVRPSAHLYRRRAILALALAGFLFTGCRGTMSPLSNRLQIGEEAFAVVVARGEGGLGDLYAVPASGGLPLQITFTRVDESMPALTTDGSVIAFIRGGQKSGTQPVVVLMNLLNGAERRIELPAGAAPQRVAWSGTQTRLLIASTHGLYGANAPPRPLDLTPLASADSAAADSALAVLLGDPAFAVAGRCRSGRGICAESDSGESVIDSAGMDPVRWGPDSVAYVVDNELQILPLGGGHLREVRPSRALMDMRQPAYAAGPGRR